MSVAVLAEEGDERSDRRRPDTDEGVDGLPVKTVPSPPDQVNDGRDRLLRPEPSQNLDGVLLCGSSLFFKQPEDRCYSSLPDGDKCIRRRRGNILICEGVHERPYSRRVADLTERPGSLAPYAVIVAVECPDQRSDGCPPHRGKFHPLFPGNQVPCPFGSAPGFPSHPIKDFSSMSPDPGPVGRQRLDQRRDRRFSDRSQDLSERFLCIPVRAIKGLDTPLCRRSPHPYQGSRRITPDGWVGEQPDEGVDRRRSDLRKRHGCQ